MVDKNNNSLSNVAVVAKALTILNQTNEQVYLDVMDIFDKNSTSTITSLNVFMIFYFIY